MSHSSILKWQSSENISVSVYIRGHVPDAYGVVGGGGDDGVLVGVVDDARHLLGVPLQDGDDLLRVLVEDGRVAVVAARQQPALVRGVDVQGQDTRHTRRVQTLREVKFDYNLDN